jgi:hypothetical protein
VVAHTYNPSNLGSRDRRIIVSGQPMQKISNIQHTIPADSTQSKPLPSCFSSHCCKQYFFQST